MKYICPDNVCTGCGLCSAQCPTKCIEMRPGKMGHLKPVINQTSCIDCGLCKRKCPAINDVSRETPDKAYAAWAIDRDEYKTSTSGGIAAVLSKYIVTQGGVVYGCAMLRDVKVCHVRIDKESDLYKLKGSKYVQSDITGIIPLLKRDVTQGIPVLFIGTPCQTAAIKNIYKQVPENLFLVDIICHGTPSLISLQKHVKRISPACANNVVKFRDGNDIILSVSNDNEELYKSNLFKNRFRDVYLNAFFDGFTYRDACYSCKYANTNRCSDITIGDFWGLGVSSPANYIPEHKYGCSAILVNTEKGASMIENISKFVEIFERPVDECVNGNEQLRHPKALSPRIKLYRFVNKFIFAPKAYLLLNLDHIIKYKVHQSLDK